MLFTPSGDKNILWDSWLWQEDHVYHLFHLMKESGRRSDRINHATSLDLVNWQDHGPVIQTGTQREWDRGPLLTGSIYKHKDLFYMFYGSRIDGFQKIGLAISEDLYTWKKVKRNPILEVDPRWYETAVDSVPASVAWRDPVIVADAQGIFHSFICARAKEGPWAAKGAIAHAVSRDLYRWRVLPPVYVSDQYAYLEAPDIFKMDSHWYLIFSVGQWHSTRAQDWGYAASGIRYLVGKDLNGPFYEPENSLLLGSPPGLLSAYVGRTIPLEAKSQTARLFYYHNVFPNSTTAFRSFRGIWSIPKKLALKKNGLVIQELSSVRSALERDLEKRILRGPFRTNPGPRAAEARWQTDQSRVRGYSGRGLAGIWWPAISNPHSVSLDITGEYKSAGLLLHYNEKKARGVAICLEPPKQSLSIYIIARAEFGFMYLPYYSRPLVWLHTGRNRLKIWAKGVFADVYLNGNLAMSMPLPSSEGKFGFLIEDGWAGYDDLEIWSLPKAGPGQ